MPLSASRFERNAGLAPCSVYPARPTGTDAMPGVLTLLLAGGAGERLLPLTREHAKPALPFGGIYRIIDITLSNCINSGLRRVYIMTQHKALTLHRHLREAWNLLSPELNEFIEILPPTRRVRDSWYLGTADAVYQNIASIEEEAAPYVLILSADHVYKMNYQRMLEWHLAHQAEVTLATSQVAPQDAGRFGIVATNWGAEITAFEEKPKHGRPQRSCFNPAKCSASMGVYLFSTPMLLEALREDAANSRSGHDFGHDILPRLISRRRAVAFDFSGDNGKEAGYWRDVGTLDAYYEANLDLLGADSTFNLNDSQWPIRTASPAGPPARFVSADEGLSAAVAVDSLISHGCTISGDRVVRSVLAPGVHVKGSSVIESSILLPNVTIGRRCRIRRAVIDQGVQLPDDTEIGFDPIADRDAGHIVTESGLVIVQGARAVKPVRFVQVLHSAAVVNA